MSTFKNLIASLREDALDFAKRIDRPNQSGRHKSTLPPLRDRNDADAISRWGGEGGRRKHRKERFDFFDG